MNLAQFLSEVNRLPQIAHSTATEPTTLKVFHTPPCSFVLYINGHIVGGLGLDGEAVRKFIPAPEAHYGDVVSVMEILTPRDNR